MDKYAYISEPASRVIIRVTYFFICLQQLSGNLHYSVYTVFSYLSYAVFFMRITQKEKVFVPGCRNIQGK
jgi:hypothetical protein